MFLRNNTVWQYSWYDSWESHDDLSMSCSKLFFDVDVCNLLILVAGTFMSLINVDHTCMRKTSFPQKCQFSSRALHNYFVITLGLLASTFKRTHWLVPGYLLGQAWKSRYKKKRFWWRSCELGRFLVRMPVGLRQMAWVQVVIEDFHCDDTLKTWP